MSSSVRRVAVLGSTGSIGLKTLDVIRSHPDRLEAVGLAVGSNVDGLRKQLAEFPKARGVVFDESRTEGEISGGMNAIRDLATSDNVDIVVVAVAGVIGLLPTLDAIRAKKDIALASKEVLVAAGEIVMPLVAEHGIKLTPIDSEHSAVFQCLQGYGPEQVEEIILTASGGPFRGWDSKQLEQVTVDQALNHPTWKMGGKITIDSATLMNKALEIIEAKWLFGLDVDKVSMVIHPQSIVHSFVKMRDGSFLAQCGWPDMWLPIQYALLHPERLPNRLKPWHPLESPTLTFEDFDPDVFRGPRLAREAVRVGGTMPCAFNAANEAAANAFLAGRVSFLGIQESVEAIMERHIAEPATLESLLKTDRWAREEFERLVSVMQPAPK